MNFPQELLMENGMTKDAILNAIDFRFSLNMTREYSGLCFCFNEGNIFKHVSIGNGWYDIVPSVLKGLGGKADREDMFFPENEIGKEQRNMMLAFLLTLSEDTE